MPVCDYQCEKGGYDFEKRVMHGEEDVWRPRCEGRRFKLLSPFTIDIPNEACAHLPRGEAREFYTECKSGDGVQRGIRPEISRSISSGTIERIFLSNRDPSYIKS